MVAEKKNDMQSRIMALLLVVKGPAYSWQIHTGDFTYFS